MITISSQPTLSYTLANARCQGLSGAPPLDPENHTKVDSKQSQPSSKRLPLKQRVTLRLSVNTAFEWRQRANTAEQSLSDWIRQCVDGSTAVQTGLRQQRCHSQTLSTDPILLRQLASIGSNVNQIARVLNSVGLTPCDNSQLLAELVAIQRELHTLSELSRYAKNEQG